MNAIAVGVLVSFLASIAHAGPTINIPAGDAAEAIMEFGRQTNLSVTFLNRAFVGIRTRAVAKETSRRRALSRMLAGTRVNYEFITPHLIDFSLRPRPTSIEVCITHAGTRVCTKAMVPQ